jgi:hypothetical protein
MMNAALGTLPFLATLWLLGILASRMYDESGAKIAAALRGKPHLSANAAALCVHRRSARLRPVMRHRTPWRAAA